MANNAHISDDDINLVLQGNSFADMSRLVLRDPDHLRAGELHRHAQQWNALLDDMHNKRFFKDRIVWFQKISITPTEGRWKFRGGGGLLEGNFRGAGGVHMQNFSRV